MEICAIICEFNPFHNGHKYIIERARELSGCDAVVCIMSGSFTQRGEICRTDKFLRAKHAVLCGADVVIELPVSFAVAPAEIFAKGAVKILSSIPEITSIAFGCECGTDKDFTDAARILNEENQRFKDTLNACLDSGESYIKSCCRAFEECGGNADLLTSPNNILAVEYAKALSTFGNKANILPIKRIGAGYNDETLSGEFCSASGIRAHADSPEIRTAMPECSYTDFINSFDNTARFEQLAVDWLYMCDKDKLKRVYGCTEGLENRLKNLAQYNSYNEILEQATTKRYSKTRIRRILCGNLLGLYADETQEFLNSDISYNLLAVSKNRADELLPILAPPAPSSPIAEKCAALTNNAYSVWQHLSVPLIFTNPRQKMILV